MRNLVVFTILLFLASCSSKPADLAPVESMQDEDFNFSTKSDRGSAIANIAACGYCHGNNFAGMSSPEDEAEMLAPNITSNTKAFGRFSTFDAINYFRTSNSHKGLSWAADEDLQDLIIFLRNVPAKDGNFSSFEIDSSIKISSVPAPDKHNKPRFGKYLVDHVARCGVCHTTSGGIFSSKGYLTGSTANILGNSIEAPSIVGLSWSTTRWFDYFMGSNEGTETKCPTRFYRKAARVEEGKQMLEAIAEYVEGLK